MTEKKSIFASKAAMLPLALVTMFFWGSLFPMIKVGYQAFQLDTSSSANIMLFAGVRFIACGLVLVGSLGFQKKTMKPPRSAEIFPVLMIALFGYFLHYLCTYTGLSLIEGSKTAILKQVGSLFIICFAFLFRKEDKFSWKKLLSGVLGFASIVVVNLNAGGEFQFGIGDVLILAASFCSAISMIFAKNAYDKCDPMRVTAWAQLISGVMLTLTGVVFGGSLGNPGWSAVGVFTYICFASCMGYTIWNNLVKYNDLTRLNEIKFTEPLFSAICSAILLSENILRLPYLFSFLLVAAGVYIGSEHKKALK
jgi:drug/metabolite transporter (DMT)-like permease